MGKFIGVWKLDKPIYCKKEVSGRCFQSNVSGVSVTFCFPSCPETYNGGVNSLTKYLSGANKLGNYSCVAGRVIFC